MDSPAQKDSVLTAHAANRAVSVLESELPGAIVGASDDRDELTLWIEAARLPAVTVALKRSGYNFLADVTCVDLYPNEPRFQVTYHLLSLSLKERLRLCVVVGGADPEVSTVTGVWPSANFYEREVWDLFGVRFIGHPDLRRIMMPDEWEGHPLRKDYPVEGYR